MDEKTLLSHSLLEINRKYTKGGKYERFGGRMWGGLKHYCPTLPWR
jgi:hypothetical protein